MAVDCNSAGFWLDIGKTFIGAFLGAGLAFLSNVILQNRQRRKENLAAGHLALAILSRQLSDFYNLRRALFAERTKRLGEKIDPKTSGWLHFRPIMFSFSDSLKFDFHSLVFLFEKGNADVVNKLALAEKRYLDLQTVLEGFNSTAELIQRRLEELGVLGDKPFHVPTIEEQLGPVLVGKGNSFGLALLHRISKDEEDYVAAINVLRKALIEIFGEKSVPNVEPMPGFAVKP